MESSHASHRLISSTLVVCLFLSTMAVRAESHRDTNNSSSQAWNQQYRTILDEQQKMQTIRQEIQRHLTPERRMQAFVREFRETGRKIGFETLKQRLSKPAGLQKSMETRDISGKITVPNDRIRSLLYIMAFDEYGYFVDLVTPSNASFRYRIGGLPPGDYTIMTFSVYRNYADEIYNNQPAPLLSREAWRSAEAVTVTDQSVEDIDFDLEESTMMVVAAYGPDGTTLVDNEDAYITITPYDDPTILIHEEISAVFQNGVFSHFFLPRLGDFKVGVQLFEVDPVTWYPKHSNWMDAGKLTIAAHGDTTDTLRISVDRFAASTEEVGQISGSVTGNGMINMIYAFNAGDLSLASLDISFYGSYRMQDVPPGEYYVFADDYLGNVEGEEDRIGTFYKDATTLAQAEKVVVTVQADAVVENIDFQLRPADLEYLVLDVSGPVEQGQPEATCLYPNYPNPFNGSTMIRFVLPVQNEVNVRIVNLRGEHVATLMDHLTLNPGTHDIRWNGTDSERKSVPSGLYFVILEAGKNRKVNKLTFIP